MTQNIRKQMYELAKAIKEGRLNRRRGEFEIFRIRIDEGYKLAYNGIDDFYKLCDINFDTKTFDDYGTTIANDLKLDMREIQKIFEKVNNDKLTYLYRGKKVDNESVKGHHTRAPAKKHSPAVKVNVRKMF